LERLYIVTGKRQEKETQGTSYSTFTSQSLVEANEDITLALNDLPNLEIVCMQDIASDGDSIVKEIGLVRVINEVGL
jgi:hypothetical protein